MFDDCKCDGGVIWLQEARLAVAMRVLVPVLR